MAEKWSVGVDGGGTKTDLVLCGADGSVAARTLTGGSNVNESGLPAVGALLEEGVSRLLELSGVPRSGITALFAGLSGILSDGGKQAEKLREFLEERLPGARCRVDGDAVNCLRSGVRQGDGLAVIAGTGSTAFACKDGEWHRIGGWGSLFDDDGSAFAIGRDLIRAILLAHDGRGEETLLTALFRQAAGADPWDMLPAFYEEGKTLVASFAPLAFEAWRQGDPVAGAILRRAAAELARMIEAAGRWDCGNRVVLCGGVFRDRRVLVHLLRESLDTPCELLFPALPPVYGAVVEACALADIPVNDDFEKRFGDTLPAGT